MSAEGWDGELGPPCPVCGETVPMDITGDDFQQLIEDAIQKTREHMRTCHTAEELARFEASVPTAIIVLGIDDDPPGLERPSSN